MKTLKANLIDPIVLILWTVLILGVSIVVKGWEAIHVQRQ